MVVPRVALCAAVRLHERHQPTLAAFHDSSQPPSSARFPVGNWVTPINPADRPLILDALEGLALAVVLAFYAYGDFPVLSPARSALEFEPVPQDVANAP